MHVTFQKSALFEAVQRIQGCVDKKNTIPILSNILLSLDEAAQRATLTATNLEIGMSTVIPVEIHEAGGGSITIPAQKLFEILRELPKPVDIRVDEHHWITLSSGKATFKIAGLPETDFPEIGNEQPHEMILPIEGDVLRHAIDTVLYSTSNDESRYSLTGVLFDCEDVSKTVKLVTTDGHRLNIFALSCPDSELGLNQYIVPKKAMNELKKLCDSEVSLAFDLHFLKATSGETTLYSRLIDGSFPDYRQVIPGEAIHQITVDRDALNRALRRVALLTSDARLVKLSCTGNGLELSANDPNLGESLELVQCEYNRDDEIMTGVNAKYLAETLNSVDMESVTVCIVDALSPIRIVTAEHLTHVIMPMRV